MTTWSVIARSNVSLDLTCKIAFVSKKSFAAFYVAKLFDCICIRDKLIFLVFIGILCCTYN